MKELLNDVQRWRADGQHVCVATVIATRRSAPRPIGSSFAIAQSGELAGSVSGGCVESEIYHEAQQVFEDGKPKLLSYGIADEQGWEVGLPCGGEIDVLLERLP
jgi:xanthine/CO dehydrogenase XdhC/CoxF family maturation factor